MGKLANLFKSLFIDKPYDEAKRKEYKKDTASSSKLVTQDKKEPPKYGPAVIEWRMNEAKERNAKFLGDLWQYEPFTWTELENCLKSEDWHKDKDNLSRISKTFYHVRYTIADPTVPNYEARIAFINGWEKPSQKVAALMVAFLPFDKPGYSECVNELFECVDKLSDQLGMPHGFKFGIKQMVLSVDDSDDPLRDRFHRYRVHGSQNLKQLCMFRNRFYKMGLGEQPAIFNIHRGSRDNDDNLLVIPTKGDLMNAEYDYALWYSVNKDHVTVNYPQCLVDYRPTYYNCIKCNPLNKIGLYSSELSEADTKYVVITAANPADFLRKMFRVLPDLSECGADFYVADKYHSLKKADSFQENGEFCGHLIMIRANRWNAKAFFAKHQELFTESGIAAANAFHLGGSLYGCHGRFGKGTGPAFTLQEFIEECESWPIDRKLEYELESTAKTKSHVYTIDPETWEKTEVKFDPKIYETMIDGKEIDETEFDGMEDMEL